MLEKLNRRIKIFAFLAVIASILGGVFILEQKRSTLSICSESDVLQMEKLILANQVDGDIAALSSMANGDMPTAKIILDAQVKSGMALLMKLSHERPATDTDAVKRVIENGKEYEKLHGSE